MTPTQQELYTHIKKHSGLMYSELFEDIGEPRGLTITDTHEEIQQLIGSGLVIERHTIGAGYTVRAA